MRSSRRKKSQSIGKRMSMIILCSAAAILILALWQKGAFNLTAGEGAPNTQSVQHVGKDKAAKLSASEDEKPGQGDNDGQSKQESPSGQEKPNENGDRHADHTEKTDGARVDMTFVGDIMFSDKVEGLLKQQGYDYPYEFVRTYIEQADIAVANLETPITQKGTPAQDKEYVYRSSPEALPDFSQAGFDLVNLANNHSMDYGQDGLLDTLEQLRRIDIDYVGAGQDADEAYQYKIIEEKGFKIAFLGFSRVVPEVSWKADKDHPGVAAMYDYRRPVQAIEQAQKEADLVVVLAHWGVEREDLPVPYQEELAHRFIDAGADLIVGGHPHVLQGLEQYKGKWIAYSLGNFIFTTNSTGKTWETAILQASCDESAKCELRVVPVLTKFAKPKPLTGDQGNALLSRISGISINAKVETDGTVTARD